VANRYTVSFLPRAAALDIAAVTVKKNDLRSMYLEPVQLRFQTAFSRQALVLFRFNPIT
jgi:hypothetical protein